jgi:hypothetical protein
MILATTHSLDYDQRVEAAPLRSTPAAARIIGMSVSWLEHDRQKFRPEIPFVRIGTRAVRYRLTDLLAYAQRRVVGDVSSSSSSQR